MRAKRSACRTVLSLPVCLLTIAILLLCFAPPHILYHDHLRYGEPDHRARAVTTELQLLRWRDGKGRAHFASQCAFTGCLAYTTASCQPYHHGLLKSVQPVLSGTSSLWPPNVRPGCRLKEASPCSKGRRSENNTQEESVVDMTGNLQPRGEVPVSQGLIYLA